MNKDGRDGTESLSSPIQTYILLPGQYDPLELDSEALVGEFGEPGEKWINPPLPGRVQRDKQGLIEAKLLMDR